jgi:enoyl-CoA hydratase
VLPADELLSEAIATARALGAHSPFAYAATKDQLHLPTRAAIDAASDITRGCVRVGCRMD